MELKEILKKVSRPARYINQEEGTIHKDWSKSAVKCCLCYPDKYEIGMSNMGIQILYSLGNGVKNALVERCFAPDFDMISLLREKREKCLSLFALESKKPLKEFDLLSFSVGYELSYTNLLLILDLAQISLNKHERSEDDPLVIIGGHSAYNPTPLTDFVDIAVIGEGEECFPKLLEVLAAPAVEKMTRRQKLEFLTKSGLEGLYFLDLKNETKKCFIKDLDKMASITQRIVPYLDIVHERCSIEAGRGCVHGCRFCQAGFISRPLRWKSKERILKEAETALKDSGYQEISLLSLTVGDHPKIEEIVAELNKRYAKEKINIALPSLRTDSISEKLLAEIQKVRKSTITIAPEAGTQRLRDIVHKNMTEESIFKAFKIAVESGARSIKLYFMIGLPGETEEDVLAIPKLAEKLLAEAGNPKSLRVTINVSNFVPKPHTPFQWAEIMTVEDMAVKQKLILSNCKRRINVRFHDAKTSLLEGLIARGDEQFGKVLINAYQYGAIFDAWRESFDFEKWEKAFEMSGIDYRDLLKEIDVENKLPWDNIKVGVPKGYLKKEWLNSRKLC